MATVTVHLTLPFVGTTVIFVIASDACVLEIMRAAWKQSDGDATFEQYKRDHQIMTADRRIVLHESILMTDARRHIENGRLFAQLVSLVGKKSSVGHWSLMYADIHQPQSTVATKRCLVYAEIDPRFSAGSRVIRA